MPTKPKMAGIGCKVPISFYKLVKGRLDHIGISDCVRASLELLMEMSDDNIIELVNNYRSRR